MNNSRTTNKIVLITGCSSGFGLLTAARLASKGCQVIASMRNLDKKTPLLNEVNTRGGEVDIVRLDVTNKENIKETFEYIAQKYGYLDVVVNNAGYGLGGAFEDLTDEEIRGQMETNFFGVQNVIREAIPLMRQRKSGKIINISSVAGFSASPFFSAYNASKWALEAFSESLRYELKNFNIDVHLIQPGPYKTKIFYENARYAKNFDNKESPYYCLSQFFKKRVQDFIKDCHKDPEEIAIVVEKLITHPYNKFRNIPDIESKFQYALRKILPFGLYSRIIEYKLMKGFKNNHVQ